MKKKEIGTFKVYKDNNGYLTIIYLITSTELCLINYNGSIYYLSNYYLTNNNRGIEKINTWEETAINAYTFFMRFPTEKLDEEGKRKLKNIMDKYLKNFIGTPMLSTMETEMISTLNKRILLIIK